MEQEKDIQKWLNHDLTDQELKAFEQDTANSDLVKLDKAIKRMLVPEFDNNTLFQRIKSEREKGIQPKKKWLPYAMRIAAILVIAFGIYQVTSSRTSSFTTEASEQLAIILPDNSNIKLNAHSEINYSEKNWDDNRTLNLKGEAYFNVEKGKKFSVHSNSGIVTVLGTQFNIKDRTNYFEVTCYEGSVEVKHIQQKVILNAGDSFKIIDGEIVAHEKETKLTPSWIDFKSTFVSEPFKYVLNEFERQHNIRINAQGVDVNQLFTGSFDNRNFEQALKAITLPMQLTYSLDDGNVVTLSPKK